jgi:hypothetical protein
MNPRAAVSWYQVNNFGKCERFSLFLDAGANRTLFEKALEKASANKKAGVKRRPFRASL